jgi:hypothetical protein
MPAIVIPSPIGQEDILVPIMKMPWDMCRTFPFTTGSKKGSKMRISMTSRSYETPSIAEVCASVKRLGYGSQQSIRLYGEEFEVISDPFPEAGGIAVSVKTKKAMESA